MPKPLLRIAGLPLVLAIVAVVAVAAAGAARAERRTAPLLEALGMPETVDIMRQEGRANGADLAREMLGGSGAQGWARALDRLYDRDRMYRLVAEEMAAELTEAEIAAILGFFRTDSAQRIVELELAARRAFLDRGTERAASAGYRQARKEDARLIEQIDILIRDSDLVERNVMGALNADLMFYRGLADGGAYDLTDAEIIADVWAREESVRAESRRWLHAFLYLAYRPLGPEGLADYAAFFRTPAGRALNNAMFVAFDRMFEEISYLLGRELARRMRGEDL